MCSTAVSRQDTTMKVARCDNCLCLCCIDHDVDANLLEVPLGLLLWSFSLRESLGMTCLYLPFKFDFNPMKWSHLCLNCSWSVCACGIVSVAKVSVPVTTSKTDCEILGPHPPMLSVSWCMHVQALWRNCCLTQMMSHCLSSCCSCLIRRMLWTDKLWTTSSPRKVMWSAWTQPIG